MKYAKNNVYTSCPMSVHQRWRILCSMLIEKDRKILYNLKYKKLLRNIKHHKDSLICRMCHNDYKDFPEYFGYIDKRYNILTCLFCYRKLQNLIIDNKAITLDDVRKEFVGDNHDS